jgi:hypothetical protein
MGADVRATCRAWTCASPDPGLGIGEEVSR